MRAGEPVRDASSPTAVVDLFVEMQRRFPVFKWRVADVHLWPLLRIRLLFEIWNAHYANAATARGAEPVQRVAGLIRSARARVRAGRLDVMKQDRLGEKRDLVFLSDGVSFARVDGMHVERFCDPLIEHAHRAGMTTQLWTPLHGYHVPRLSRSSFVQPAIDRANARALLLGKIRSVSGELSQHAALVEWLRGQGILTASLDPGRIRRDALRVVQVTRVFASWLGRVQPCAAFLVNYYSLEGMAFVRACRMLGIPVTDLQHGVQGSAHAAYAGWGAIPDECSELLPDFFWVWSQHDADAIVSDAGSRSVCVPVLGGNPWLAYWADQSRGELAEALRLARHLAAQAAERPIVLVTLQYGLMDDLQIIPLQRLIELSGGRQAWWIRLHPAMSERREEVRRKLARVSGGCVWLDEPSDFPLQALLLSASLHLTHSSSTVIEASACRVHSVITSRAGEEAFARLIEEKHATVELGDPESVLRVIEQKLQQRPAPHSGSALAGNDAALLPNAFQRTALGRMHEHAQ